MTEVVLLGSLAALMAKPAVLVLRAVVRRRRGLTDHTPCRPQTPWSRSVTLLMRDNNVTKRNEGKRGHRAISFWGGKFIEGLVLSNRTSHCTP